MMPTTWGDNAPPKLTRRQLPALVAGGLVAGLVWGLLLPSGPQTSQPAPPAHGCVMWNHGRDIMCAQP